MQMAVGLSGAPTAFLAGWLGITTMALSCAVHSFMAACCRCGDIIRPWSLTAKEHEHTTETTASQRLTVARRCSRLHTASQRRRA